MDDLQSRLARERGIGRVLAARLIERFGDDLAAMAAADLDVLLSIDGIGDHRVKSVKDALSMLAELSGVWTAPNPTAEPAKVDLPAVTIPTDDGGTISVQLPAIVVQPGETARLVGMGLDLEVSVGDRVRVTGTWDGQAVDDDGHAVVTWDE